MSDRLRGLHANHKPYPLYLGVKVNSTCEHCFWGEDCHKNPQKYSNCIRMNRLDEFNRELKWKPPRGKSKSRKRTKVLKSDILKLFVKKDGSCPMCEIVLNGLDEKELKSVDVIDVTTQEGYVDALYYRVMSTPALMYDDESKVYDSNWIVDVVKNHYNAVKAIHDLHDN